MKRGLARDFMTGNIQHYVFRVNPGKLAVEAPSPSHIGAQVAEKRKPKRAFIVPFVDATRKDAESITQRLSDIYSETGPFVIGVGASNNSQARFFLRQLRYKTDREISDFAYPGPAQSREFRIGLYAGLREMAVLGMRIKPVETGPHDQEFHIVSSIMRDILELDALAGSVRSLKDKIRYQYPLILKEMAVYGFKNSALAQNVKDLLSTYDLPVAVVISYRAAQSLAQQLKVPDLSIRRDTRPELLYHEFFLDRFQQMQTRMTLNPEYALDMRIRSGYTPDMVRLILLRELPSAVIASRADSDYSKAADATFNSLIRRIVSPSASLLDLERLHAEIEGMRRQT